MPGSTLVALKWHDSTMGWLRQVDAGAGEG